METSLIDRLLNLGTMLEKIGIRTEDAAQEAMARGLAQRCRAAAYARAIKELKSTEDGYKQIEDSIEKATKAASQANKALEEVGADIAKVATAFDLAAKVITLIASLLKL